MSDADKKPARVYLLWQDTGDSWDLVAILATREAAERRAQALPSYGPGYMAPRIEERAIEAEWSSHEGDSHE